ncbi:hypothetical protein [Lysinibacillus sp. 54212]|uniref:hypothetical protein n=1 Tax=Lysinibacillus sp. 54212 TaxID=3119829 RepID=UPI002FCBBE01
MKKILVLLFAAVLLVACGDSAESKVSMESIVEAFEKEGITIDTSEKPMFQMLNAKDGVMFYNESNVVKIYEFESVDALEDAKKENELLKDWPSNGAFLIETSDEIALEVFKKVK